MHSTNTIFIKNKHSLANSAAGTTIFEKLSNSTNILIIGLYWFVHYCLSFNIISNNNTELTINFGYLVENRYMHSYFQYLKVPSNYTYPANTKVLIPKLNTSLNITQLQIPATPPKLQTITPKPTPTKPTPTLQEILRNPPQEHRQKINQYIRRLPRLPQLQESPPKIIEQIIQATKEPTPQQQQQLQPQLQTVQDISILNINICDVITQIINKISEATPQTIEKMSTDVPLATYQQMSITIQQQKSNTNMPDQPSIIIPINTSVINAVIIYKTNPNLELESSFKQWIKEKTISYLKDLYAKTDLVQNIIKTLVFCPGFIDKQDNSIITNLMRILNQLYTIIDEFYKFFIIQSTQPQNLKSLIDILIDYETNVIDILFIEMQNYINFITADKAIQDIFFPQQQPIGEGGSRKSYKNKKQHGGERQLCFPKCLITTQPLMQSPNCITDKELQLAKQTFIEHLICGYPTPAPYKVYAALDAA
jgi:hypothetical protein